MLKTLQKSLLKTNSMSITTLFKANVFPEADKHMNQFYFCIIMRNSIFNTTFPLMSYFTLF